MKKTILIVSIALVAIASALVYFFVFRKNLADQIVLPYIAHQKPRIDPHIPSSVPIADKLDEVLFDGLFNISANPSGIVYEDGLGEFMGLDEKTGVVSVRLKPRKKWHTSYSVTTEKKKITVEEAQEILFTAQDLRFTLEEFRNLAVCHPIIFLYRRLFPILISVVQMKTGKYIFSSGATVSGQKVI